MDEDEPPSPQNIHSYRPNSQIRTLSKIEYYAGIIPAGSIGTIDEVITHPMSGEKSYWASFENSNGKNVDIYLYTKILKYCSPLEEISNSEVA